jgi:hypothetical protein
LQIISEIYGTYRKGDQLNLPIPSHLPVQQSTPIQPQRANKPIHQLLLMHQPHQTQVIIQHLQPIQLREKKTITFMLFKYLIFLYHQLLTHPQIQQPGPAKSKQYRCRRR